MSDIKKLTVTVAIPAFNEAANIASVVDSILHQTHQHYQLEKIVIVSDGSSDETVKIAHSLAKKDSLITVLAHSKREGKVKRLNQIFAQNRSDILVVFDADIKLGTKSVIDEMVLAHINNPKIAIVVAHQIPLKPRTFIGQIIYAGYELWDTTRLSMLEADYIQNLYGAATAFKKSFASKISIPAKVTDETGYLYLLAKQQGGFKYLFSTWIYYWPVMTLHDFFKLADRSFTKNQEILASIFGPSVHETYLIPTPLKIKAIVKTMLRNPIYTSLSILLNVYSRLVPHHDELYDTGMWEMSTSSKVAITEKDII